MADLEEGWLLIVKTDEEEYTRIELGEGANYSLDSLSQTVRIWDQEATYLMGTAHLVLFKKPNERRRGQNHRR